MFSRLPNMSSLRKYPLYINGTVDEVFEAVRNTNVVFCVLLMLCLVLYIIYVIWKMICRRSTVTDQEENNHEYYEMDLTTR